MRFSRYLLLLCGWLLPTYAAPPPMPFDQWTNQNGVIQVACPAGYTCFENVVSDNMIQRILTRNNSGETYVHVIIEDNSTVGGQHRSESFVNASNDSGIPIPLTPTDELGAIIPVVPVPGSDTVVEVNIGSINSGIATQMTLNQTGTNNMTYSYILNTGWANTPGQPAFSLQQNLTDTTAQGIVFDYVFDYTQNRDANNRVTGWLYGVNEFVQNSAVISAGGNGGTQDDQRFVLRRASGDFITGGSALLPPSVGGMGMGMMGGTTPNPANGAGAPPIGTVVPNPQAVPFPNPPGAPTGNPMGMGGGGVPPGGTVAWNTGNEVQVIWIGQVCPGCVIAGMGMMGGMGTFGFQQYENVTTGQAAASRSILGIAPFTWTNPPFGPQPGL